MAADDGRRRGRRGVPADRRPGQPVRHHPGAGQGRAHGRRRRMREDVAVTGIELERRPRHGRSSPTSGRIDCEKVVLLRRPVDARAGGDWPASTCRWSRCSTSTSITEPIAGVTAGLPTLRDPDRLTYYKEEVGGLVMGGYEPNPMPWAERRPAGAASTFQLLDDDWDHFEPMMELALGRVPALADGRRQAADQRPGELHPRRQLHPRRGAGDQGHLRRRRLQRLRHRRPAAAPAWRWPSGSPRASRRTTSGRSTSAASAAATRTPTGCAPARSRPTASTTPWPGRSRSTTAAARCAARRSTRACWTQGAVLRREAGLGAPELVRRPPARSRVDRYSYGRQNWFAAVGREHRACRERVALFDQTSFAKFLLVGRDAEAALSWICANDVAKPPGTPDLHPDAQRPGRHRVRPDRGAAGRRPVLPRHRHRLRHPRLRLDRAQHPGRARRRTWSTSPRATPCCR